MDRAPVDGGKRLRILVIDDEPLIREVVRRLLGREGCDVAEAPDGTSGLAMAAGRHFDAVITDVRMPGLSGLELLGELKRANPEGVVIMMTGYADMEMVLAALRADADDFVMKPVNVHALAAVVRRAIDRRDLRADLAALRRQAQLRHQFLSFVSHKLNTPLTSVLLFLDSLTDEGAPEGRLALLCDGLPDAVAAGGRLRELIAQLLRFAEATAEAPRDGASAPPTALPLEPFLAELLADAGQAAVARGIRVRLVSPHVAGLGVLGTRDRLRRAFRELLDNAVKFNRDGGEVRVEVVQATAGGPVEVRVIDTGPGIPEADLPKVFEPFEQVDPAFTGQIPGLGLGLALARRLVEADGGRLALAASPSGTVATVTLPPTDLPAGTV